MPPPDGLPELPELPPEPPLGGEEGPGGAGEPPLGGIGTPPLGGEIVVLHALVTNAAIAANSSALTQLGSEADDSLLFIVLTLSSRGLLRLWSAKRVPEFHWNDQGPLPCAPSRCRNDDNTRTTCDQHPRLRPARTAGSAGRRTQSTDLVKFPGSGVRTAGRVCGTGSAINRRACSAAPSNRPPCGVWPG